MKNKKILSFVLPQEILEYFEVTEIKQIKNELHIYLEEKNMAPETNLESKGFYPEKEIQDFPIRGKPVFLKIKRRRWRNKETKKEVKREINLNYEGTKYTNEFTDFLKELAGN